MTTASKVRRWYKLHKWSSLVCTAFLLISCLTGLPLIFHDEIDALVSPSADSRPPIEIPRVSLDSVVRTALHDNPSMHVLFVTVEEDAPHINVGLSPGLSPRTPGAKIAVYDAYTGARSDDVVPGSGFMEKLLLLHRGLFAGVPGELFMGVMALLFVISLVSGALVYGPFMRRLDFGTYRSSGPHRTRWFDLHNLLGIVTLCWALVVGITGVMNAVSDPLFEMWRASAMPKLLAPYRGKPPAAHIITADAAAAAARRALPQMKVTGIVFPNPVMSSPHHFLIYTKGRTPITSRIFTPVLVDAETGQIALAEPFPWYIHALEVSRPLHFGDYGGLPLKILWAVFDSVLILVLCSGVYLWVTRRSWIEKGLDHLVTVERGQAV